MLLTHRVSRKGVPEKVTFDPKVGRDHGMLTHVGRGSLAQRTACPKALRSSLCTIQLAGSSYL